MPSMRKLLPPPSHDELIAAIHEEAAKPHPNSDLLNCAILDHFPGQSVPYHDVILALLDIIRSHYGQEDYPEEEGKW